MQKLPAKQLLYKKHIKIQSRRSTLFRPNKARPSKLRLHKM